MYKILSSSSIGNAVIYFDTILVDCGIAFATIKPYIKNIQLILLSHEHGDHFNPSTLKAIQFERPSIRIGCGNFMTEKLTDLKNIDVFEIGKVYNYGAFKVSPVRLYHDVPNLGYRIFKGDKKIFHATDTFTLEGIAAKNYDLYALEANYDETKIWEVIKEKEMQGEYAYQRGAINSHLSIQQAQNFVIKNANNNYEFITLHQSKEF
ncbi:MAG: MBL fold metallo-hydrolase [Prevotellaceae bacterium]|jgi:phosphoribosyl 1,2-cyclic phosphodiesterase|nr:MBL fold metallo-hydrolase [Prevotellaceae bacterium]